MSMPSDADDASTLPATRARAALEPGGGDRLGHRVRPQRRSGRPADAAAAGAARHRHDAERAERRRDVHRRASIGPLLAPRFVRRFGIRNFLLACFGLDIVLFLALKAFDSLTAWFVLRRCSGRGRLQPSSRRARPGSTSSPATWAAAACIGIYAAALSAGFGIGPLILSLTGIEGWPPFLVNAAITALAALPLLGAGDVSRGFGRERGAGPLRHVRTRAVDPRRRRGVRPVRGGAYVVAADLGRAQRPDRSGWRRRPCRRCISARSCCRC